MRTTLKRGVGRAASGNGNGRPVYPPAAISPIARYQQPPHSDRAGLGLLGRILLAVLLAILSVALGVAGGTYLWFHQSVEAVRAHSVDVKVAQKALDVAIPGQAAVALVVGYDFRVGDDPTSSRSDTLMLIRADPDSKTISLLSFPRDLIVPVYCPGSGSSAVYDRINSAYARCGSKGTLETVRKLTGIPINYLITVNFRGFRQIVDEVGGVWIDVDRRYYNRNVGTAATNFSNIDLQPGYQRLNGSQALSFVRFRHTDSDFFRLARQQAFVQAFKEQVSQHFDLRKLPGVVSAITHNVEVGSKTDFSDKTVLGYALFAATLPGGHFFQVKIDDVSGYSELHAPQSSIEAAVNEFSNPDVRVSKVANAGGARQEGQVRDADAEADDRHGPERQRRRRLGGERELPARPARLPDAAAARERRAERAHPVVLPLADLLRCDPEGLEAGGARPEGADRAGRRAAAAARSGAARAQSRGDAPRGRGPDVPQHRRRGARRRGAQAPACQRPLRPDLRPRPRRALQEPHSVPADGAERARALVLPGHAPRRQARAPLLDHRRQQGPQARLPDGWKRVLGDRADRLDGGAGARGQELPAPDQGPGVRPLLPRQAPAHGRRCASATRATGS